MPDAQSHFRNEPHILLTAIPLEAVNEPSVDVPPESISEPLPDIPSQAVITSQADSKSLARIPSQANVPPQPPITPKNLAAAVEQAAFSPPDLRRIAFELKEEARRREKLAHRMWFRQELRRETEWQSMQLKESINALQTSIDGFNETLNGRFDKLDEKLGELGEKVGNLDEDLDNIGKMIE